jgi:dihydrofolate reductase
MGRVTVIEFITLDGVVTDPDALDGTPNGGWAFRHGPEAVAGDKFRFGALLKDSVLLLGRKTWERFTGIWPSRDDEFSQSLNTMAKAVVSNSLTEVSKWNNSTLVEGDVGDYVRGEPRNVIVTGSLSVVRRLQRDRLIDEYRLLTFPSVVSAGERLFGPEVEPTDFTLASAVKSGAAVLSRYERVSS